MKKRMVMLVILALAWIGYSEDSKEPAELTAAKKDYSEQIEKVTAPVKAKQLVKLEKLKKQLTTKGDLPGAMAVQAEIDALASVGDLVVSALVGKWEVSVTNGYRDTWIFNKDGKVHCSWNNGIDGRWSREKDTIVVKWDNGWKNVLMLPIDSTGIRGDTDVGKNTLTAKKIGNK